MAADIIDLKDRMKNTADKKTVAEKVQDLKEAYALISPLTNLPYVECEQENFSIRFCCMRRRKMQKQRQKYMAKKVFVYLCGI